MTRYVALCNLMIPNPGQVPSVLKLTPGDIFSLDGNEGIHIDRLIRNGNVRVWVAPKRKVK